MTPQEALNPLQVVGLVILLGFAGVMLVVAVSIIAAMLRKDIRAGRYDSLAWVGMGMGAAAIVGVGAYLWRYG